MDRRRDLLDGATGVALSATAVLEYLANASLRERLPVTLAATLALVVLTALRRRRAWPAAAAAGAVLLAQALLDGRAHAEAFSAVVALLLLTYSVAATCPLRRALSGGALLLTGLLLAIAVHGNVFDALLASIVLGASWSGGRVAHRLNAQSQELRRLAQALADGRERSMHEAVLAERARIARDLHDVVAHHVSVMVVQAGGARGAMHQDPAAADDALRAVEDTGRDALTDMRRLLGVLRTEQTRRQPQPRLEDGLARLEAGEVVVSGSAVPLDAGRDLTASRLLQEALTNARRHGLPPVRVAVHWSPQALEVVVENAVAAAAVPSPSGHGLLGMQERVHLYGGVLQAGATAAGWRLRAVLPLDQAPGAT